MFTYWWCKPRLNSDCNPGKKKFERLYIPPMKWLARAWEQVKEWFKWQISSRLYSKSWDWFSSPSILKCSLGDPWRTGILVPKLQVALIVTGTWWTWNLIRIQNFGQLFWSVTGKSHVGYPWEKCVLATLLFMFLFNFENINDFNSLKS